MEPRTGERILDLATGPGTPAMPLARLVAPSGRVTGVDLSEKMIDLATRLARERALVNAEFRVMDAEHLQFPDATFDAVVSRFGFHIFTNPEAVAREAYRVLVPGGRLAASVWSTAERAQALHVLVGAMMEFVEPDENGYIPTPYELGEPGAFARMLEGVGFRDCREDRRSHVMAYASEDEYFDVMLRGTPLAHSVGEESPDVREKILRRAHENLQAWRTASGFEIPCECVVVTARK